MKNTERINEIYGLYDAYIQKVNELEQNKKITAGLLGLTKGPKDDPCHDQFADDLREKLQAFAASDPDPAEVRSLLSYMFSAPLDYRDQPMIYWMLAAVHGLASDLVCLLGREDAAALCRQYSRNYPRWERLPVQKNILKALKEKEKG